MSKYFNKIFKSTKKENNHDQKGPNDKSNSPATPAVIPIFIETNNYNAIVSKYTEELQKLNNPQLKEVNEYYQEQEKQSILLDENRDSIPADCDTYTNLICEIQSLDKEISERKTQNSKIRSNIKKLEKRPQEILEIEQKLREIYKDYRKKNIK